MSHTCDSCHRRQEEERKEETAARGEMSLGAAGALGFFLKMVGERKTASLLITESLSWGEQGYSNNLNGRCRCEFDLKLSVLSCCFLQTITFYMQSEVYGKVSLFCLPNRLSFHIPPPNCSVLAVLDGEQNVSSEILMHAPSARSFLSFLPFFFFLGDHPVEGNM